MLNVLQVIPTLDRSGAEKQMVMLAKGLPRDRFRVEVAALTRLGPLEGELRDAGVPIRAIGKRHKVDPGALGRLSRLMREGRFDVVQTWIFAANAYGRIAARRAGVPVTVVSEMAVDLWKGRGELAVDRWLAKGTDAVVGNSRAVVEFYRDRVGVPGDRLEMIHSGIDEVEPPEIDRQALRGALGLSIGGVVMLFVGRLAAQKRVDVLLNGLDLLRHARPNVQTLIVGDGPLGGRLVEMAKGLDLLDDGRVRFLGHREDVPRLLALADLLVLPSEYEGLPNVVLEAMRFRKPVVATRAPGTTEVVEDEGTGLLVPVGDPALLARAIMRVIDDPELARRLGEGGRARVDREFRLDGMIGRYAELYERLARAKGLPVAGMPPAP